MHPRNFVLEKMRKAAASSQETDDKVILRIDREALKAEEPKVRFAAA